MDMGYNLSGIMMHYNVGGHLTRSTKQLLYHKRNEEIFHDGRGFILRSRRSRRLVGLLPFLKGKLWSDYDFRKISQIKKKITKNPSNKKKTPGTYRVNDNVDRRFDGILTGNKVHQQINDFVSLSNFSFRRKNGTIHPWSRVILEKIFEYKWVPLASEFMVYDEDIGIATKIDLICLSYETGTKCLVFIELKTGYDGIFLLSYGAMAKPFSRYGNSYKNQASFQITCGYILAKHKYGFDAPSALCVLNYNKSGWITKTMVCPSFINSVEKWILKERITAQTRKK